MDSAALATLLEATSSDFVGKGEKKAALASATRSAVTTLWEALSSKTKKNLRVNLQKIYVEGFDAEQIWCQLDLQTPKLLKSIDKHLRRIETRAEEALRHQEDEDEEDDGEEGEPATSDDSEFEEFLTHELAEEQAKSDTSLDDDDEDDEDDDEDDDSDDEEDSEDSDGKKADLLPTEDRFFRLGQMEDFVQQAEELFEREMMDDGDGEPSDEDDVGEDFEDDDGEDVSRMMYRDYFGREGRRPATSKGKKSVTFALDNDDDDDDGGEGTSDEDQGDAVETFIASDTFAGVKEGYVFKSGDQGPGYYLDRPLSEREGGEGKALAREEDGGGQAPSTGPKSKQEIRSERMRQKINKLEEANISEAHWTMRGEVKSNQRPQNSLLEVDLDFQQSLPPIEPTQEIATEIEDIIKQRILEKRFDDVIPVVVSEAPEEARTLNEEELDDKKSTRGLAEMYEQDFMQARGLSDIEEKQKRKQEACWALYRSIAARLDAMSHFQFTPKPVTETADRAGASTTPAVAMEEVGLEAVSTAGTLAPAEVQRGAKGLTRAEAELEQKDRKARRRTNKKRKKAQRAAAEEEARPKKRHGRKDKTTTDEPPQDKKVRYSKSGEVFKLLQDQQEAAAAAAKGK